MNNVADVKERLLSYLSPWKKKKKKELLYLLAHLELKYTNSIQISKQ